MGSVLFSVLPVACQPDGFLTLWLWLLQLALLGHAYNVDLPSRQVQISWLILGCGTFASTVGTYDSQNCGRLNTAVDFYFDGAQSSSFSYDPDTSLLHRNDTNGLF